MAGRIATICLTLLALAIGAKWCPADWIWNKDAGWVNMGEAPPSDPANRFAHACALMTNGDYAPALEQLQSLYAQDPPISLASKVKLRMAECLFHMSRYEEGADAAASLIEAKAPGISLTEAWQLRYECAARAALENPQSGAVMLDEASVVTPDNLSAPAALLKAAETYSAMKQPDKAVLRLERLRAKFPDNPDATIALRQIADYRTLLSIRQNAAGQLPAAAAQDYSKYLELDPQAKDTDRIRQYIASLRSASGEPDSDRREACYGILLLQRGQAQEALAIFSRLAKAHKKDDTGELASYYEVLALERSGKPEEAYQASESFLKQYPTSAYFGDAVQAEYRAGSQLLAQGNEAGLKAMDTTFSHDPQGPFADDALLEKGNRLLKEGRFVEAKRLFEELLDKYPARETSAEALFRLGQSRLDQYTYHEERVEILTKAREAFDFYAKRYPNGPFVTQAQKLSKQCRELEAEHMWSIAQFYMKQQLPESAVIYANLITTDYGDTTVAEKAKSWLKNRGINP